MSNKPAYVQAVMNTKNNFTSLNESNGGLLDFRTECGFALQQIRKNDFTMRVASDNQASLQMAISNVAAIGISLNPANAHAYLVPRKGVICLDISYKGLVKLATDSGAIKWAKAELVYKEDKFTYNGIAELPTHNADVFSTDRGALVGGYCVAKLSDDSYLVDHMNLDDIHKVRQTSMAYSGGKSCPWNDWYEEMCKKTLVKRASKSWPQSTNHERFAKAVQVINEHEGLQYTAQELENFRSLISNKNGLGLVAFMADADEEKQTALFNSFEKGTISANKQLVRDLCQEGRVQAEEYSANIQLAVENNDLMAIEQIKEELDSSDIEFIKKRLTNDQVLFLEA